MAPVAWHPEAVRDLEALIAYWARWSSAVAARNLDELLTQLATLRTYPMLGRTLPELRDPEVREILFRGHRIAYRIRDDTVIIAGIRHGSSDLSSLLVRLLEEDL